jgi:hypothetical protein
MFDPGAISKDGGKNYQCDGERGEGDAPIDLGQLQHEDINNAAAFDGVGVNFGAGVAAQFSIEQCHGGSRIQTNQLCVGTDETANVDRGGEGLVVSLLERPDMVRSDFGDIGDLVLGQAHGLAPGAELFGNGGHCGVFIAWAMEGRKTAGFRTPDIAFSGIRPGSCTPPIQSPRRLGERANLAFHRRPGLPSAFVSLATFCSRKQQVERKPS